MVWTIVEPRIGEKSELAVAASWECCSACEHKSVPQKPNYSAVSGRFTLLFACCLALPQVHQCCVQALLRCRCWLNVFVTLVFSSRDAAQLWHSLKPFGWEPVEGEPVEEVLVEGGSGKGEPFEAQSSEAESDCPSRAVFDECVKLHHTLRRSPGSTHHLFGLIEQIHPKLVTKPRGHAVYQQQDVDEAFTLLFDTLKSGMEQAGMKQQVRVSAPSCPMHTVYLPSQLHDPTVCTEAALCRVVHHVVTTANMCLVLTIVCCLYQAATEVTASTTPCQGPKTSPVVGHLFPGLSSEQLDNSILPDCRR